MTRREYPLPVRHTSNYRDPAVDWLSLFLLVSNIGLCGGKPPHAALWVTPLALLDKPGLSHVLIVTGDNIATVRRRES